METCYEVEIRVRKLNTPDKSGSGPFTRADALEPSLKVIFFPEVWGNPAARNLVFRQVEERLKTFYQDKTFVDTNVL